MSSRKITCLDTARRPTDPCGGWDTQLVAQVVVTHAVTAGHEVITA